MEDDAARLGFRCEEHAGLAARGYCVRCEEMAKLKVEGELALLREEARHLVAMVDQGHGLASEGRYCVLCDATDKVKALLPENEEAKDG